MLSSFTSSVKKTFQDAKISESIQSGMNSVKTKLNDPNLQNEVKEKAQAGWSWLSSTAGSLWSAAKEAASTIAGAKAQAENIVNAAAEQATRTIEDARIRSDDAIDKANKWSAEIRIAAGDFIEDIMKTADEAIANSQREIRAARENIKNVTGKIENPGEQQ